MPVLTAVDVLNVQGYVFASNQLNDVISASWVVHWATSKNGALDEWEKHVIFAAGGNALLEFETFEDARLFAAIYTRLLLDEAPALGVVIVHRQYSKGEMAAKLQLLQLDLAQAKLKRKVSAQQLGLSINASCKLTGLPACGFDQNNDGPLSKKILFWRKSKVKEAAQERWSSFLQNKTKKWEFPLDLDQMGRSYGESSILGVVHVDGNGIGDRIRDWLNKCVDNKDPDQVVRDGYRKWSEELEGLMEKVLQTLVDRILFAVQDDQIKGVLAGREIEIELDKNNGVTYLPMRPVLLGGDDLTILCDGRIALDLAACALKVFETSKLNYLGSVSACAGIALVHTHYPFFRAYEIAEKLCSSAKSKRREKNEQGSWLDWHLGELKPGESISSFREQNYSVEADVGKYATCRPYRLNINSSTFMEDWRWLTEELLGSKDFGFSGNKWSNRRNKIKQLPSLVRRGPVVVRRALETWQIIDAELCFPKELGIDGFFSNERSPLIDAVEILDLYFPLINGSSAVDGMEVTK